MKNILELENKSGSLFDGHCKVVPPFAKLLAIGILAYCSTWTTEVHAQKFKLPNVGENGQITGFSPKQGAMVQQKIASSAGGGPCGVYLRKKGHKQGINRANTPREFVVAIGTGYTDGKIGDPDFIDDRYIAFRNAWLDANSKMAQQLEESIRSDASLRHATGKGEDDLFKQKSASEQAESYRKQANQIQDPERTTFSAKGTINKGVRWLNAELDKQLKKLGHDVDLENQQKAEANAAKRGALMQKARAKEAEAKNLLRSSEFREVIEAAAKERMKGTYTDYVVENIPTNSPKAHFCVVLKYSKRSEGLADAMAARDFSNVPKLKPVAPLVNQLPDPSNPQGVFELVNKWGITIKFDENANVNLVAFGQAGIAGNDSTALRLAKTEATLRAKNLIRLFINQTVAIQQATKAAKDVKTLKNEVTKVQITKNTEETITQGAGFRPINGISEVLDWQGVHPATSQGIYGVVYAWNAAEAAGAIAAKSRQNLQVEDTGGASSISSGAASGSAASGQSRPPSQKGGLTGTNESEDF